MMRRRKELWQKTAGGLWLPPMPRFAPGYPCCCYPYEGTDCSRCDFTGDVPDEWTIDYGENWLTGCDGECETFDGEIVVSRLAPYCRWQYLLPYYCGGGSGDWMLAMLRIENYGATKWRYRGSIEGTPVLGSNPWFVSWYSAATKGTDCEAPLSGGVLTLTYDTCAFYDDPASACLPDNGEPGFPSTITAWIN